MKDAILIIDMLENITSKIDNSESLTKLTMSLSLAIGTFCAITVIHCVDNLDKIKKEKENEL